MVGDSRIVKRRNNFSMISNIAIRDDTLSLRAKGLYSLIQAYLDIPDFVLFKSYLMTLCKESHNTFDSAWKELKDAGYLLTRKIQTHKGFVYEYELLDEPMSKEPNNTIPDNTKKNEVKKQHNTAVSPTTQILVSGDLPTTQNPTPGELGSINNTVENNTNNKIYNNYNNSIETKNNSSVKQNVVVKNNKFNKTIFALTFSMKLKPFQERDLEIGNYFFDDAIEEEANLIKFIANNRTLSQLEKDNIQKLHESDVYEIYAQWMIINNKYNLQEWEDKPVIHKKPEAFIIGVIRNKLATPTTGKTHFYSDFIKSNFDFSANNLIAFTEKLYDYEYFSEFYCDLFKAK